jgi:prepilin signal peptidase PulO-like enzyme (type II secretory pathway)
MDFSFVEVMLAPWTLALLGLCIGSFLNVVIHRLPQMLIIKRLVNHIPIRCHQLPRRI